MNRFTAIFIRILKQAFMHPFLGTRWTQFWWEKMHQWSLYGMNIGYNCDVTVSGEKNILKLLGKTFPARPLTVFDVGANVGNYAEAVLEIHGAGVELHCFEPTRVAFARLQERFVTNARVTLNPKGLGSLNQSTEIYAQAPGSSRSSMYPERFEAKPGFSNETVNLTTLAAYCSGQGIRQIHLLKMDVEGHELEVLRGAEPLLADGSIRWIQFEFGGCNLSSRTRFKDFFALLSPRYRLYRVLKDGLWGITEYSERLEIYSTVNYLAQWRGEAN